MDSQMVETINLCSLYKNERAWCTRSHEDLKQVEPSLFQISKDEGVFQAAKIAWVVNTAKDSLQPSCSL